MLYIQDSGESSSREAIQPRDVSGEKDHDHRQGNQVQRPHGNDDGGKRQGRGGNSERDRSYKDKHKAKIANHNRKTAAAKKYSKGMM